MSQKHLFKTGDLVFCILEGSLMKIIYTKIISLSTEINEKGEEHIQYGVVSGNSKVVVPELWVFKETIEWLTRVDEKVSKVVSDMKESIKVPNRKERRIISGKTKPKQKK